MHEGAFRTESQADTASLEKSGQALEAIIKASPPAAYDAKRGNFAIDPGPFARLIYEGV